MPRKREWSTCCRVWAFKAVELAQGDPGLLANRCLTLSSEETPLRRPELGKSLPEGQEGIQKEAVNHILKVRMGGRVWEPGSA